MVIRGKLVGDKEQGKGIAKKIAYAGMLIALAMIFSYVESFLVLPLAIPGVKLGLANLVVLTGLYYMKPGEVLGISVARIVLVSFLFGNMASLIYSLAGGLLSFAVMVLLKKTNAFSTIGVSVTGAVSHNLAQVLVAALVVNNVKMFYYLPILMLCGIVTGIIVGVVSRNCLKIIAKL